MATRRKGTKGDAPNWELTPQQQTAVDVIVSGKNYQETADAIGVTRPTVSQWANHDPGFQAMLNQRRQEVRRELVAGLQALAPKAMRVLEQALDGEQALQAAVHILRATRLYGTVPPAGPTDPQAIALAMRMAEDDRQHAAEEAELAMRQKEWNRTLARLTNPLPAGLPDA